MRSLPIYLLSSIGLSVGASAPPTPAQECAKPIGDSSWYAHVSQGIRQDEYAFRPVADDPGVWSAPNRSQELRSRISRAGLEVFPRTANADGIGAPWKLSLSTKSFGRVGALQDLDLPSITTCGNRVELDHGVIREWFENADEGIEHGWTMGARPLGVEPLWIGLEFRGDLGLRIDEGARSGTLVDAGGAVQLRYRNLLVFDASGRELGALLKSSPWGVGIQIDDTNAIYPLTVDPVLTGPAWTAEGNLANAYFGQSVATAGDVNGDGYSDVIVGAHYFDNGQTFEGRAFVYLGSATGLSTSAAWTAESDQANAFFGISVATAGDVNGDGYSDVIVGAVGFTNGQLVEGRALVYFGSASGLSTSPGWTVESDQELARLGCSVATAGDVNGDGYSDVIVGAQSFDNGEAAEGRAFMYLGSASGPSSSPDWTAESDQAGAFFGTSVATAGDVNGDGYCDVIIGAHGYTDGELEEGRAFVYQGSATGLSISPAWTAESDQASAAFGYSVATAGDVNGDGYSDVIVGAYSVYNGESYEGRAYAYLGSASGLSTSAVWTAEGDQADSFFGVSVSTAGDVNGDGLSDVIVGAGLFTNGQTFEGRAFVYLGSASGLSTSSAWTAESDQTGANFGISVSTAGDVNGDGYSDVIVGAHYFDNGEAEEGRAFVYQGSATGLSPSNEWAAESDQASASFGIAVSTAGDVNGDGFSDLIVGASLFDNGQSNEGRAYAYLGSASGPSTSPTWTAESDQADAYFGGSVSTAGDVNGDGYGDVIVGAYAYDNGESNEGRAYAYLGSAAGLAASPAWTAESDHAPGYFGQSVSSAGDVNGDGFGDVIVGAPQYVNGETTEGAAFVYMGAASGLAPLPAWVQEGNQISTEYGTVAGAGDVNGDGYSDVIVGAPLFETGETNEGGAYVYLGSAVGLSTSAGWTVESDQAGAIFGYSVSTAGDVNGDGYSDVIVGAQSFDNDQANEGRAFVYLGSASGLSTSPSWTAESDQSGSSYGYSVSTAGDVNGDGYSDVVVGAWSFGSGGRAYGYSGSASGLSTSPAWTVTCDQASAAFGVSIAAAGDVNGDGYADVIIGASDYDNGQGDEGLAFVYLGNEARGGWTRGAQQRRYDGTRAISLLGRSDSRTSFRIRLAFDREHTGFEWADPAAPTARLEWEVRRLGDPLDGTSIQSGAPQAITGSPLVFEELVGLPDASSGSAPALNSTSSYHWRARLRTNNPLLSVTPWVTIPGNNVTETKLRVVRRQQSLP